MVERSQPDGHGNNVVNVILVDFRGLDTLGEITVLATASIGMVALARAGRRAPRSERRELAEEAVVRHLVVLDVSVRLLFHVVLITSVYLLLAGHNQPGGGFVGGLLVGAAIAMRYAAGGIDEVRALPVHPVDDPRCRPPGGRRHRHAPCCSATACSRVRSPTSTSRCWGR